MLDDVSTEKFEHYVRRGNQLRSRRSDFLRACDDLFEFAIATEQMIGRFTSIEKNLISLLFSDGRVWACKKL